MVKKIFSIEQKSLQNILVLLSNDTFSNDIKKLRKEYLNSKKENKNPSVKDLLKITDKIEKLRIKYKLSQPHFVPISWLILFDKKIPDEELKKMYRKPYYKIITNRHKEDIVYIPIYPETTIEDIRDDFAELKKISKEFYKNKDDYKRAKTRPKINRDFVILRLKRLNYSNTYIKNFINIFSDDWGLIIKDDVPKIIKDLKKSAKKII